MLDQQLIDVVSSLVAGGWRGLITLYVVYAVIKQFRLKRNGDNSSKEVHDNPSKEFHNALKPIDERLTRIEQSVTKVDRRVARIEGHLDIDGRS